MWLRLALVLGLLAMLAPTGGCPAIVAGVRLAMPDSTTIKPEFTFGERSVTVIPFRDVEKTYFESNDGIDLATSLTGELISRKAVKVARSSEPIRAQFGGQNLDAVGWAVVGRAAGTDLLLIGDIQDFRLRDPGAINLYHGYSRLIVRVIDAKTGCVVYQSPAIETWCPDFGTATYAPGIPDADTTPERIRRGLMSATALKVGQKFYQWERPNSAPPTPY